MRNILIKSYASAVIRGVYVLDEAGRENAEQKIVPSLYIDDVNKYIIENYSNAE